MRALHRGPLPPPQPLCALSASLRVVRIAVVGVGSAGLSQIKQCIDAFRRPGVTSQLELVAYEPRSDVGGLWNYDPDPKPFAARIIDDTLHTYPQDGDDPTPLYEGLVATLPHELMAYRDHTFSAGTDPIPTAEQISEYLHDYATKFDLRQCIRFRTRVTRLYRGGSRRWVIESRGPEGEAREEFDYVSVTNGHYSDPWTPPIPGISSFPGRLMHSREFRRAADFAHQTVLVIGSFSSGSDITRLIGSLNLRGIPAKVYQSSTGIGNSSSVADPNEPWRPYIHPVPLIDRIESDGAKGRIHFQSTPFSHDPVDDVDIIIFATGYYNSLPFCKAYDEPWRSQRVLEEEIDVREGGDEGEVGGLRGLHMEGMDEMLLFLKDDRSIAFPGLPYQIVPFPFAEAQSRLVALFWAGLVGIPPNHTPPRNTANLFVGAAPGQSADADAPIRYSIKSRKEFIFPNPYEWSYTEDVFALLKEVDSGAEVPQHWREVERWRKEMRADTGMRKRLLGY